MKQRRRITTEFVAHLAGLDTRTVNLFIQHDVFPFKEFATAVVKEGNSRFTYIVSPERLREHYPYTDEELQEFYDNKRAAC